MYHDDLAYIQHHGFSDFAKAAGPGLLAMFRRAGISRGHVLDLGCGDGTWLREVTARGFAATGVDRSPGLIKYARTQAPAATVRSGSLHQMTFPGCDVITALGEVLSYLPPGTSRPRPLGPIFRRAYRALRPGGLLVFDLLVAGRPMSYLTWRAGNTWAVLARVEEQRHTITREIVTFRRIRGHYRRGGEHHRLSVFRPRSVLADLRRAGFVARTARGYGRFPLPDRRLAFIAQKRVSA